MIRKSLHPFGDQFLVNATKMLSECQIRFGDKLSTLGIMLSKSSCLLGIGSRLGSCYKSKWYATNCCFVVFPVENSPFEVHWMPEDAICSCGSGRGKFVVGKGLSNP